jgi:hypothetical protein
VHREVVRRGYFTTGASNTNTPAIRRLAIRNSLLVYGHRKFCLAHVPCQTMQANVRAINYHDFMWLWLGHMWLWCGHMAHIPTRDLGAYGSGGQDVCGHWECWPNYIQNHDYGRKNNLGCGTNQTR